MSETKYCYEVGYKSTEDIPRIHADMKALGGVVTAVRFGPMDEDDQARAPAVKWRDGEPPEGVEVLFERPSSLGSVYDTGHSGRVITETVNMMSSLVGVPICESSRVIRYIPLSELLPKE